MKELHVDEGKEAGGNTRYLSRSICYSYMEKEFFFALLVLPPRPTCLPSYMPAAPPTRLCLLPGGRATFAIEVEWSWPRPTRYNVSSAVGAAPPSVHVPVASSLGERLWNQAVERHVGVGATSNTLPWKALYTFSLAEHFLSVMGDDGRYRPLQVRPNIACRSPLM